MNKFLTLTEAQRRTVFEQTAIRISKSRHLYDLYKMLEAGIAGSAITNDELWETIRHHREVFTSIRDVDYTPDIRKRIVLTPPESVIGEWKNDYDTMFENLDFTRCESLDIEGGKAYVLNAYSPPMKRNIRIVIHYPDAAKIERMFKDEYVTVN